MGVGAVPRSGGLGHARLRLAAALLAALTLTSLAPFTTVRAYSKVVPGDRRECAAAKAARPQLAKKPCVITITSNRPLDGAADPYAAQADTLVWWMSVNSVSWQVKMTYQLEYGYRPGYVKMLWRSCTIPYAIGVDVDINWCSAYPDWFEYDGIDVGTNWKVSFLYRGFPASATYWMRRWHTPWGEGTVRWGRG